MGQNISITQNENNNIQTNIEILLDDLLERDYKCDDLNNTDVIITIQQHIQKVLSKMPHDQLSTMYKQIEPERMKGELKMGELLKYYTQKFITTMCIYTLRDNLMDIVNSSKETDMNSIKLLNTTVNSINELDEMAKQLVEEVIHTSYTSDGKMRKKKYIRERQLTRKQLDDIMKKLKSF